MNISANAVHPGVITTNLFRNRTIVSGIVSSLAINFVHHMNTKGFLASEKHLHRAQIKMALVTVPPALAALLNSIGRIICRTVEQVGFHLLFYCCHVGGTCTDPNQLFFNSF